MSNDDNVSNVTNNSANNSSSDSSRSDDYEKICYICRRTESKAGKMISMPGGLYVCPDCMQKTFDAINNNDIDYNEIMKGIPNMPNMGMFGGFNMMGNDIPDRQKVKKKKEKAKDDKKEESLDLKKLPAPHEIKHMLDEYVVGQMRLEEMVTDRKAFGERVQENAIPDLQKMGLEMISFNVQSFADQNNVIEDLGIDNISQIKKGAAVAKAQADRDIAIAQAQAAKEANEAKVQSEMEIAEKQTSLAIRQAELKQQSDVKKAEADAAYSIQEQEQRKTIEIASANADIARAERTAELKAKEVDVTKQTLDAQIRAKADAERYAAQQAAEAELFRRTKEAEAKMIERKREAEGIRAVGEAEAEAIKLKALAEAEGIDKKAEAMKKYGEAAVVEMIMNALPEIAKNVAEPLSKVDKITMYGEGNSAKLLSDIVNGTTQVTEGIASGMGIDIKSLIMGALGGKLASDGKNDTPVVVVQPSTEAAATQNNKTE